MVGAAGGLGGFFLPAVLGSVKELTGQYTMGFVGVTMVFAVGTLILLELGSRWSAQWHPAAVERAGVYSYRTALRPAADESAA